MAYAVEISNLNKSYRSLLPWKRGAVHAVRDFNLQVEQGEIFGLLGPNGAGKTTAIKLIAGLIKPDRGKISFPATVRRPSLGAVLEGSRNLYWRLSPWENICYFGEVRGVPMAQLTRQADQLLELFGIADKRNKPAQTLSRGMQQKLAVVLAFLGNPELMLLDEPTLGLDVASSRTIQRLLKELSRERGITIIVTTHQMDVAQSLCRRVGIMREGLVAECEEVARLVEHFRRQDYVARMSQEHWRTLQPILEGFEYEECGEPEAGQISIRFKLQDSLGLYPLMERLGRHGVELSDFHQELPSLEEIFLAVTGLDKQLSAEAARPESERRLQ